MSSLKKRVPIRTCLGCARKAPKLELNRLCLDQLGRVVRDLRYRMPGRGAYVCGADCAREAARRRRFERAFRTKVSAEAVREMLSNWTSEVRIGGNETKAE